MSRPAISRRMFLRGSGLAIGLPFLPSLAPRRAWADEPTTPGPRFVAIYAPCGAYMPRWTPPSYGALTQLSPSLTPFAPYADRTTVVSGLDATATADEREGFHRRATASWLTCTPITPTYDPSALTNGWSIDQLIADALHADTRVRSLQVGQPLTSVPVDPIKPYSAVYMQTVSWRGNLPLMTADQPTQLWRKVLGGVGTASSEVDATLRKARGRSVLDFVRDDMRHMKARLGVDDAARLDEYLTTLRNLEQGVAAISSEPPVCGDQAQRFTDPALARVNYDDQIDLMFELVATLLACDATRVASMMISAATPSRIYYELGHTRDHHTLTHHEGNQSWIDMTAAIDQAQARFAVRFLDAMASRTDATGASLLDDTVVLYGSGMGDGSLHDWHDCPMLYVGDARGRLRTGRHVDATGRPMADLHLTLLQAMGLDAPTFADATGPISALRA